MHIDPQVEAAAERAAAARHGRGLLVLGLLAVLRCACRADETVTALDAGRALSLELSALTGVAFRLLPGVGPTLAERLEQARREAGGVLTLEGARDVHGVGPVLLDRWRRAAATASDRTPERRPGSARGPP